MCADHIQAAKGRKRVSDENTLRQKAREALQSGRLPHRPAERMWGGPGSGADCPVCGNPLTKEEMGFDIEFAGEGEGARAINHHFHIRCFAAWEFERRNINGAPENGQALQSSVGHGTIAGRERNCTN
jgi:hypothetical protein